VVVGVYESREVGIDWRALAGLREGMKLRKRGRNRGGDGAEAPLVLGVSPARVVQAASGVMVETRSIHRIPGLSSLHIVRRRVGI